MTGKRWIVPAAGVAIVGGLALAVWPFTIDDAYIPCRYAANLASGQGLVWQAGERAQGITGIAWTLLLALARAAGIQDLPAVAKVLGLACGVAVTAWTLDRAERSTRGRLTSLLTLASLGPSLSLAAYSVAGLETAAFTLAVTIASLQALRRPIVAGLLAGLSVALRPEGALVLCVLAAVVPGRRRLAILAAAAPLVVATAGIQWLAFGSVVPDTLWARQAPPGAGALYLMGALLPTGALLLWPLALVGGWQRRSLRPALAVVVALTGATVALGGDWMPAFRFFVPVWPVTALLAARGALNLELRLRRRDAGWARRLVAASPIALLSLAAGIGALTTVATLPAVREAGLERERAAPRLVTALERLGVRRVALVDVGFIGWSGLRTVDLAGLTHRPIARARGDYLDKEVDERLLFSSRPDAIVLHTEGPSGRGMFPVERRVASLPRVQRDFRLAAEVTRTPRYRYLVLISRMPPE